MRTYIDYRKKENIMHPKNVWLHEDLSDLAKATCPEEELLSLDPDVLLYDYTIDFWMKDIVSRQGEVDRRLYDIAVELEFANNFQIAQHPDILDMFVSLRQHFGHVYTIPDRYATRLQTEEDKLQAIQHARQFDFEITVKESYVDDLVQRLIKRIIEISYQPSRELVDNVLQDDNKDFYPYGYYPSISERIESQYQLYLLMVILYPHDNLPDYLHDQMVYMNYQNTASGEQSSDLDQSIVNDRLLLASPKDEKVYDYVIKKIVSMFD